MHTFSFSGNSSVLRAAYNPPVDLRNDSSDYELGLISLETFNAIPNIDTNNNKFYIGDVIFELPIGSYEVAAIEEFLLAAIQEENQKNTKFRCDLYMKGNTNTLKCEIKCNHPIDFTRKNTSGKLLGFHNMKLEPNVKHVSATPVDILKVNVVKVECNITTGAYHNGDLVHTIHEFSPSVPPGFKIIEVPRNVIYMPITTRVINSIELRLLYQMVILLTLEMRQVVGI